MSEISPRERALMQSTGTLLDHLDNCDECQWMGMGHCEEVSSVQAVLRADRVMNPEPPTGWCGQCHNTGIPWDGDEMNDHCPLCKRKPGRPSSGAPPEKTDWPALAGDIVDPDPAALRQRLGELNVELLGDDADPHPRGE